jgi:NADPH:quinone reductase-like Zn-dependent oxidoreductase
VAGLRPLHAARPAQDFTKAASGCDAAFDTVGGDVAQRTFAVLKPGGRAAFIASGSQAPKPLRGDVQALRPNVVRDRLHLERLVALFEAGVIRVPEVTRFPLSEAAAAHHVSQTWHFRGKLVLVVRHAP